MTQVGEKCLNCGMGEVPHLRGMAIKNDSSPCPGYKPEGGITKEQGFAMFGAVAKAAGAQKKMKTGRKKS